MPMGCCSHRTSACTHHHLILAAAHCALQSPLPQRTICWPAFMRHFSRPRLDFERMEAFATEPTLWKTCHIARARCTCYQSGRYRSLYGRLIWRHHFLRKLARLSGGSKSVFAISSHDASSYSVTTIKSFSPLAITSRAERKAYALCIGNHLAVHIWCWYGPTLAQCRFSCPPSTLASANVGRVAGAFDRMRHSQGYSMKEYMPARVLSWAGCLA